MYELLNIYTVYILYICACVYAYIDNNFTYLQTLAFAFNRGELTVYDPREDNIFFLYVLTYGPKPINKIKKHGSNV